MGPKRKEMFNVAGNMTQDGISARCCGMVWCGRGERYEVREMR